jgi:hypothetical protein
MRRLRDRDLRAVLPRRACCTRGRVAGSIQVQHQLVDELAEPGRYPGGLRDQVCGSVGPVTDSPLGPLGLSAKSAT